MIRNLSRLRAIILNYKQNKLQSSPKEKGHAIPGVKAVLHRYDSMVHKNIHPLSENRHVIHKDSRNAVARLLKEYRKKHGHKATIEMLKKVHIRRYT